MVQDFKNKSERVGRKRVEDVHENFRNHALASNCYKLFAERKLSYIHILSRGEAKQYCHSTLRQGVAVLFCFSSKKDMDVRVN